MTMVATRLEPRIVEKPWGRRDLAPWLPMVAADAPPVGELIFDCTGASAAPLLIKALFTAQAMSVQVHPDDAAARALGLAHGKDEAWVVLAAEPGATVALGLKPGVDARRLAAAARTGALVELLVQHHVGPGDVLFAPAGTIHAIGAGLAIVEIQQNLDLTYRLHDYGRPRELHLAEGLAVTRVEPWTPPPSPRQIAEGRCIAVDGARFVVEQVRLNGRAWLMPDAGRPVWVTVVAGAGTIGGAAFVAGEVWRCDGDVEVSGAGDLVLAYPGAGVADTMWRAG
jgi:mannose-6-phosphate isomerase